MVREMLNLDETAQVAERAVGWHRTLALDTRQLWTTSRAASQRRFAPRPARIIIRVDTSKSSSARGTRRQATAASRRRAPCKQREEYMSRRPQLPQPHPRRLHHRASASATYHSTRSLRGRRGRTGARMGRNRRRRRRRGLPREIENETRQHAQTASSSSMSSSSDSRRRRRSCRASTSPKRLRGGRVPGVGAAFVLVALERGRRSHASSAARPPPDAARPSKDVAANNAPRAPRRGRTVRSCASSNVALVTNASAGAPPQPDCSITPAAR